MKWMDQRYWVAWCYMKRLPKPENTDDISMSRRSILNYVIEIKLLQLRPASSMWRKCNTRDQIQLEFHFL